MRKLSTMLERGLMLLLTVMPAAVFAFRAILVNKIVGIVWLCIQTLLASLTGFIPAYIGNYSETEVLRYEGAKGNDPNPDREAVHVIVKEGHRYPIRLICDVALLTAGVVSALIMPSTTFIGHGVMRRLAFAAGVFVLNASAMYGAASYCLWTEIPGMVLGFFVYVVSALYLNFSTADNSDVNLIISMCALAYLFFGGLCLNRAALANSVSTDEERRKTPAGILRRNRRIVLGFSCAATAVSFIGPVREAAIWLWGRFSALVGIVARFLRGSDGGQQDTDAFLRMMEGTQTPGAEYVEIAETESSQSSMILVYIFFGFVGLAFLWLVFDALRKLTKKLSELMERFASGISEGYYDERRNLKDADDSGRHLSGLVRDGLKKLFTRETPWDKLSERDKARRLLRDVYARRGRKIRGLASKTAKEALKELRLEKTGLPEMYDRARYSEHEIPMGKPDDIRKEIRP